MVCLWKDGLGVIMVYDIYIDGRKTRISNGMYRQLKDIAESRNISIQSVIADLIAQNGRADRYKSRFSKRRYGV